MERSNILTYILLGIAGVLLILIGSFAMTLKMPSLFIALLYLIAGILIVTSVTLKYVTRKRGKK